MPFTKKATSPKLKRMAKHVEKNALEKGATVGSAMRQANGVVKKKVAAKAKRKRASA